jgi:hypothetical protein
VSDEDLLLAALHVCADLSPVALTDREGRGSACVSRWTLQRLVEAVDQARPGLIDRVRADQKLRPLRRPESA